MARLSVQDEFQSGDNVTATNLNNLVNQANFVAGASNTTDDSTLEVHTSGYLKVKNNGVGDEHLQQMTDAQVTTIGNENGRAVTTNHIRNDAVTNAKIANLAVDTDQIAADAVEFSKMQNMDARTVIGNNTDASANPTAIPIDDLKDSISNATPHTTDSDSDGTNDTGGDDGLMSAEDKTKLDGIEAGAEENVQSDWTASSGDAFIKNKPNIAYTSAISDATTSASGLMSASDKTKLNGIDTNANNYSLPIATPSVLGGVQEGGDIDIDSNGVMTVNSTATNSLQGVGGWTFVTHTNIFSKSASTTTWDEEIHIFGRSNPSIPSNARYALLAHEMNQGYCEVWTAGRMGVEGSGNYSSSDRRGFTRYGGGDDLDGGSIFIVENLQLPELAFEWSTFGSGGTPQKLRTDGKYPTSTTHANLIPSGYVRMRFGTYDTGSLHRLYILGYAY